MTEIVLKIPEEFEQDFSTDRFKECFERVLADCKAWDHGGISGRYEHETFEMLLNALCGAVTIPKGHGRIADVDKMLDEMRATRTYDILFALERVKPIIEADKD